MWTEYLKSKNVSIQAEGEPVRKPSEEELDGVEKETGVALPPDYRSFCREVGPGVFGDLVTIKVPCPENKAGDLVRQITLGRKNLKFFKDELPGEFNPQTTLSFASTLDGQTFYWRTDRGGPDGEYPIIVLDNTFPPRLLEVAPTFREFVGEACLGRRLVEIGLYGYLREDRDPLAFYPTPRK